jgi:prepilin-type N-terminal cleavage/methylation domain-containing protein
MSGRKGFTLIELSIVLVIIGLIVGGVLTGRDLIRAAELRSVAKQSEEFNTAVNTFRLKYNGIPGDLINATQFGWVLPDQGFGVSGGDGLLQSTNGATEGSIVIPGMETSHFWYQLANSGLIKFGLSIPPTARLSDSLQNTGWIKSYLPTTKENQSNFWLVWNENGVNYYSIFGLEAVQYTYGSALASSQATNNGINPAFSPVDARQIDEKLDDGKPNSGFILAKRVSFYYINTNAIGTDCAPTAENYGVTPSRSCGLSLKMQ